MKIQNTIIKFILASIPVIAALSWNDVMKHVFYKILPGKENFNSKLLYALILTSLVVVLYYFIIPMAPFLNARDKESCKKILNDSAPIDLKEDE